MQRHELAVEVALRDGVAVDEGEGTDPRPHERLRRVRTDAADTEHGDGRAAQFFEVFFPDKGKFARIL